MSATLLIASCGGNSPVAPSAPAAAPPPAPITTLTVTGGDTGKPLAGVRVLVAGVALITDAAGQVRPIGAASGATIDIIAPGYLDRQTQVRTGSENLTRFTLWPRQPLPQFNEDYTNILVYTSSTIGTEGASRPLRRLGVGTTQIRVILPPDLFADSTSRFFHQFAADAMNTAVSGLFRYTVGSDAVAGSLSVLVSVNPTASSCGPAIAFASVGTNGVGDISSVSITYCDPRWARDGRAILHEMGHTLGLLHSPSRGDVMFPQVGIDVFSERELLVMKLMYQRPSGNVFPDNDRSTAGLSSNQMETIVCSR